MGASETKLTPDQAASYLLNNDIDKDQTQVWSAIFSSTSADVVFETFTPNLIKDLLEKREYNLGLLLYKALEILEKNSTSTSPNAVETLSAIRIFTRLLPHLIVSPFAQNFFWNNKALSFFQQRVSTNPKSEVEEEIKVAAEEKNENEAPPKQARAILLMNALRALLFCPTFTISSTLAQKGFLLPLKDAWESGIGVSAVTATGDATLLSHRTEVLKCLLACFSETLYQTPETVNTEGNKWLEYFTTNSNYSSLALFYSLVNVSLNYDAIGWGVPYNHIVFADYREELTDASLQFLNVLLHFKLQPQYLGTSITNDVHIESTSAEAEAAALQTSNIYVLYLRDLQKKSDFEFLFTALERLLNNPIYASSTYLPNSTKKIECHQELLAFFWKLIQENQGFLRYVLQTADVLKLVYPILYFIITGRKTATQIGFIHLCTFILLSLSGEREFAVTLNKPFQGKAPPEVPVFVGSYADLLILVFHKVFVDSSDKLEALFECFLTIIANISPYLKTISMVTCIKLLKLFDTLSTARYLSASERNHRYLFFLLETFNNIVQYQYEGNSKLIYALIRHQNTFTKLNALKFEDLQKVTAAKEPAAEPIAPDSDAPDSPSAADADINHGLATNSPYAISSYRLLLTTLFVAEDSHLQSNGWKQALPLSTVLQLINVVIPQIQNLLTGSATDEAQIITYLQKTTLVGLLPIPHPILIRKYQQNEATDIWTMTYIWGVIFKRNQRPALFYGTPVKLFVVHTVTAHS